MNKKYIQKILISLAILIIFASTIYYATNKQKNINDFDGYTNMNNNLKIEDLKIGDGLEAQNGKIVTVNYVGKLLDGKKFDSSYDRNQPFSFTLGAGQVIQGWEQGILSMKIGGERKLTIPPEMAYGESGVPNVIPPNATLIFEVELLDVK
ncbi:MAG: Peptidyl-prolyl cis-trans isomerase [Parcubacteria group bacterium GW2011_GWB1_41_4]|nr:MAG: Peptidyl-prolyl cis-trans isomerase [Parcubacteria group bacterium GW2011_GWB1_41_4]